MNNFRRYRLVLKTLSLVTILLASCSKAKTNDLKVAATPVPHAQILESVRPMLKEQGINLVIVVTDDFNMPNRALAEKEIDANFFQHLPFLKVQVEAFDYPLISLASIELEPMGAYSKRFQAIDQLPQGAIIAIPHDPTNETRALKLLESHHLIRIDERAPDLITLFHIAENPKGFKFIEVDAAMLARTLDEVDLAVINTNYALSIDLIPEKEALFLESKHSPYANILAIRKEDIAKPQLLALKKALTSEQTRQFILSTYQGAVIPTF